VVSALKKFKASTKLSAQKRRRQLLEVAAEAFAKKGYDACSMDEIADHAGVTKSLLYQHFASKKALYLELLDEFSSSLVGLVTSAVAAAGSPSQQIHQGVVAFFSFVKLRSTAFSLLFGRFAPADPELNQHLKKIQKRMAEAVVPLIEIDLNESDRRILAYGVIGSVEGAARELLNQLPNISSQELYHKAGIVSNLIWSGIRSIQTTQ
jgi:AcrR family transcriptional regulator